MRHHPYTQISHIFSVDPPPQTPHYSIDCLNRAFETESLSMVGAQFSTKDRILGAAESLFAQQGFAGTSLREVTSRADVNIAAVNYHFGSKENLINEVFRRRLDELSARRLGALQTAREQHPVELEAILVAFIEPALALSLDCHGGSAFVRVLARAYAEKDERLRQFMSQHYGHVMREFSKTIAACLPDVSRESLSWRLDFVAGALTYAMADFGHNKRMTAGNDQAHCKRAAQELVRFAAAGLQGKV